MGEIRYTNQEGVARMVLCNPSARNAMSEKMMMEFADIVQQMEEEPPRILLLIGEGTKSFCSGGDLRDVRSSLIEKGQKMSEMMNDLTLRIKNIPMFVIVGVEGAAIGGGAELVTLGDWVIASKTARIQFVQVLLGVSTGWGGGQRLLQKCPQKAIHMLLGGKFSVLELHHFGLVDQIAESGCVRDICEEKIQELLTIPTVSMCGILELIRTPEREIDIFSSLWGGEVHRTLLEKK